MTVQNDTTDKQGISRKKPPGEDRKGKLSQALRKNLLRRKAAAAAKKDAT